MMTWPRQTVFCQGVDGVRWSAKLVAELSRLDRLNRAAEPAAGAELSNSLLGLIHRTRTDYIFGGVCRNLLGRW